MKHNKILFFDVDGVVNIPPYDKFDKDCLANLYYIIKNTGAKIVVSSSWRCGDLKLTIQSLKKSGMTDDLCNEIIGETIRGYHHTKENSYLKVVRGNEIGTWIDRNLKYPWHDNPEMDEKYRELKEDGSFKCMRSNKNGIDYSYVILDDDNDMLFCQRDNFIQIDGVVGLTIDDAVKAVNILNVIDK